MAALNSLRKQFLYQTQHCVEATAVDKALCECTSADPRRSTMDREGRLVPNRKRSTSRLYIVTLLI